MAAKTAAQPAQPRKDSGKMTDKKPAASAATAVAEPPAEPPKVEKAPIDRELQTSLRDRQRELQIAFKEAADRHCGGDLFAAMNHDACRAIYIELAAVTTKLEKAAHSQSRKKKIRIFADEFAKEVAAGITNIPFSVNGITYPSVASWVQAVRDARYGALKDANVTGELKFVISGLRKGRGNGDGSRRLVHRDKDGRKLDKHHPDKKLVLSNQGTPALSALVERYPKVAKELLAKFGSDESASAIEKRRKIWDANGGNPNAVVFELPDGTKLTQQT